MMVVPYGIGEDAIMIHESSHRSIPKYVDYVFNSIGSLFHIYKRLSNDGLHLYIQLGVEVRRRQDRIEKDPPKRSLDF